MALSDTEIKDLVEIAGQYKNISGDDKPYLQQALEIFNKIIEDAPASAYYYSERASVKFVLSMRLADNALLESAIADIDSAIGLEPDRAYYYMLRGSIYLEKFEDQIILGNDSGLNNIIANFKECLKLDPALISGWFSLISIYIVRENFEEAISLCAQCKLYITTDENKLTWSYLECVARILSGDSIDEESKKDLYNENIRDRTIKYESIVIQYLSTVRWKIKNNGVWNSAAEIARQFIKHFGSPEIR